MNWPLLGGTMTEAVNAIVSGILQVILSMGFGVVLYVVVRESLKSNRPHGK